MGEIQGELLDPFSPYEDSKGAKKAGGRERNTEHDENDSAPAGNLTPDHSLEIKRGVFGNGQFGALISGASKNARGTYRTAR